MDTWRYLETPCRQGELTAIAIAVAVVIVVLVVLVVVVPVVASFAELFAHTCRSIMTDNVLSRR